MNRPPLKMPPPIPLFVIACSLLSGCGGVKVVTIPTTEPLQLAEPIKAYVYVQTKAHGLPSVGLPNGRPPIPRRPHRHPHRRGRPPAQKPPLRQQSTSTNAP